MTKINKNKQKINHLLDFLNELFPHAHCELNYQKPYELAIAVMLSAQSTDVSVNKVTAPLFQRFDSLEKLANADIKEVENIIKTIGLYKNKARNVVGIARKLINDFDGQLPSDKEALMTLPGIANKSAGVIRAEIFNIPELPVDTHILRITERLKLRNKSDDATKTEQKLKKIIDEGLYIKTHHQLIHFGRYFCTARKPCCVKCKMQNSCGYYSKYFSSTASK